MSDNNDNEPKIKVKPFLNPALTPKAGLFPLVGAVLLCIGFVVYGVFFKHAPTEPSPFTPAGIAAPDKGTLGLSVNPLPRGAVVILVYPDTPAARAGLRQGDLIINIDGMAARGGLTAAEFSDRLKGAAGSSVTLTYIRDNDGTNPVTVTLTREAAKKEEDKK
jgi:S1-C subfamily serine protease